VNFEDAKPDNFILEPYGNKFRLVGIDNDHAFVLPLAQHDDKIMLVKCILYCLDQMGQPIHPSSRERFLAFSPERILNLWLEDTKLQNQKYLSLFSPSERRDLRKATKKHTGVIINTPFRSGCSTDIYQTFIRIQYILRDNPKVTPMQLLREVVPQLGIRYEEALKTHPNPWDRFKSLTDKSYAMAVADRCQTLVGSSEVLKSMNIPISALTQEVHDSGPEFALRELEQLANETKATNQQLETIHHELQKGNISPFMKLCLDTSRESVINGIRGVFTGIDFSRLEKKVQSSVLSAIIGGKYRSIRILNCASFDKPHFSKLVATSYSQLLSLDIDNCGSIQDSTLSLIYKLPYLSRLRLAKLSVQKLTLPHPSLRRLEIFKCTSLQELEFPDCLAHLELDTCYALKKIEAKSYVEPTFLYSARLNATPTRGFKLLSFKSKACPKLKPWWGIFQSWLQKTKYNELKLENVSPNPTRSKRDLLDVIFAIISNPQVDELITCLQPWVQNRGYPAHLLHTLEGYFLEHSKRLDLKNQNPSPSELKALIKNCPNLTSLNLQGCENLTDEDLRQFAESSPDLIFLDLCKCVKITDNGIKALTSERANLTGINLAECSEITNSGLNMIAIRYEQLLSSLNIKGCNQITDGGISLVARYCTELTNINFGGCNISVGAFAQLIQNCPKLTQIALQGCIGITDTGLTNLSRFCPNLTSLNLSECSRITGAAFATLVQSCQNLSTLKLHKCDVTDDWFSNTFCNCSSLTKLDLTGCSGISDEAFPDLARIFLNLTSLNITACSISDIGVMYLADGLPLLSSFCLRACNISDQSLAFLANCPDLMELNLWGCQITDAGLSHVKNWENLTSLNIGNCAKISEEGLGVLARTRPSLMTLSVWSNNSLTNSGLMMLANKLSKLVSLNLGECNIGDSSLVHLGTACPNLTRLNVVRCKNITTQGLTAISELLPNLKFLISDLRED